MAAAQETQAGEFVREEIHKIRRGEHGARSAKQAIAIGLSQARRAGVNLPPPGRGKTSARTHKRRTCAWEVGQGRRAPRAPSAKRSRAIKRALKREGHRAASRTALSRQTHSAARHRTAAQRSASAKRAARTKGPVERSAAARKAARTLRSGIVPDGSWDCHSNAPIHFMARLVKVGDHVSWNLEAGHVSGTITKKIVSDRPIPTARNYVASIGPAAIPQPG